MRINEPVHSTHQPGAVRSTQFSGSLQNISRHQRAGRVSGIDNNDKFDAATTTTVSSSPCCYGSRRRELICKPIEVWKQRFGVGFADHDGVSSTRHLHSHQVVEVVPMWTDVCSVCVRS